jgi:signal transduction histidine kinase
MTTTVSVGRAARILHTVLLRVSPFEVRRRPVDWVIDGALFVVAVLMWGWNSLPGAHPQIPEWFWPLDQALGLAACLLLWWTRRYPVLCAVLVLLPGTVAITAGFPTLVVIYRLALLARPVVSVLITALHIVCALPYHAVVPIPGLGWVAWLIVLPLVYALALCLGLLVRARRHVVEGLRASAERDRESYERRIVDTRREERERIAREMHDVLAHRISLLSVHAGALEYRAGSAAALSVEEVRQAATVIRENAHLAVEDLRELLELLRDDDAALGRMQPQPRLADVAGLAVEARSAGQRVDLLVDVDGREVRDTVQRTAYRVVQESLTNARKHAPGAAVRVRVTGGADGLRVVVENPVPVGVTNTDLAHTDLGHPGPGFPGQGLPGQGLIGQGRPGLGRGAPASPAGGGAGLIGLAERVRLDGGTLTAGIDTGRFRVCADLPGGTR